MSPSLNATIFLTELPAVRDVTPVEVLEAALDAALAGAQNAWPGVRLAPEAFLRHGARQAAKLPEPEKDWAQQHTGDLYLALACAERDGEALRALKTTVLPQVLPALRRVDASETFVQERLEELLERVVVPGPGERARIAEYSGQGPLAHWLQAAALRLALNALRARKRHPEVPQSDSLLEVAGPAWDPALELLRERYAPELSRLLQQAMQRLSAQDRNVLELHFVQGLSLNQIGAVYQANKSTISRWLARARQAILEDARMHLAASLSLPHAELESLFRVLGSQLDVSLSGALR